MIFLQFPNFNIYSTPLLVLALQGLIFAFLFFIRFSKTRKLSDLYLGLILLIPYATIRILHVCRKALSQPWPQSHPTRQISQYKSGTTLGRSLRKL